MEPERLEPPAIASPDMQRRIGSAGLETAWFAAGKYEAYFTVRIATWNVAAGILLVQEAGGKISNFKGNAQKPERSDLLFTNGKLHSVILHLL